MKMRRVGSHPIQSVMQWFEDGIEEGENGILVYPNVQTFREICMQYAKDQLVAREEEQKEDEVSNNDDVYHDNNNRRKEQLLMPRIILIATFYDTVNAVKHNLSAVGVDVQSHIDDGSLLIVDAFDGYYPDVDGMKKLVASLSERARKEGRIGVSVISNMGFFFLYDGDDDDASELISYETSLPSKIEGGNVRGFSCYHARDYKNLDNSQKKELLTQGQKKSLEVTESAANVVAFDS
jgi:hypothetical protein